MTEPAAFLIPGIQRVQSVTGGSSAVDSDGGVVYPEAYAQVLTYNVDNTLATQYFTDGVNTWTRTYSYTTGLVTGISKWVKS